MTPAEITYSYWRSQAIGKIKIALGVVVIALLLVVIIWPLTNPVGKALKLTFTSVKKTEMGSIMMNPSFHGIDKNNQPFNVSAEEAEQIDNNNIRLKQINGDITLKDGNWIYIKSNVGNASLPDKIISLNESVNIMSDVGYEFTTDAAKLDLKSSTVYGDKPVVLHGLPGVLNATGFEVLDNGTRFLFHGPVELVIYQDKGKIKE